MLTALGLAMATLVSEDLACVTAGLLIQRGEIGAAAAIAGCTAGIFAGDCGLWALGRLGGGAVQRWGWFMRRVPLRRMEQLGEWLEDHAAGAILTSRLLPGTRLPLYVTAGLTGMSASRFTRWTFLAALLWTPPLVLVSAWSSGLFDPQSDGHWANSLATALVLLLFLQAVRAVGTESARRRAAARLARWRRWEFWPMWLFYAPVAAWVAVLSVRYRGLSTITSANPGIPDGGVVGESKFAILQRLPADCTIPSALIGEGSTAERVDDLLEAMRRGGWRFPLVLKPDVGQRGVGVKLIPRAAGAAEYLSSEHRPVLAQPYHEGPFEAGVFYFRYPGSRHGRILSITDKHFPTIVGDGRSSIADLIWSHARYRLQAPIFLERHRAVAGRVLAKGELFQLAIAGNHAQGTLFRDGSHLKTPALERCIDEIAQSYPGFFVGRFDIRYRCVDGFRAGRDIAIVELNGATAESTNIYDPSGTLLEAYRQLFRQWAIVFAIGASNRAKGSPATPLRRMLMLVRAHISTKVAHPVSD